MRLHPMTRLAINTIILRHKPVKEQAFVEDLGYTPDGSETETTPGEATPTPEAPEQQDMYYYAVLMMNHTVISIFKNHQDIAVTATDINIMHNYTKTNLKDRDPENNSFFKEICLPGMTEDFKLPVLYTYSIKSDLKICYVCEEQSEKIQEKLT